MTNLRYDYRRINTIAIFYQIKTGLATPVFHLPLSQKDFDIITTENKITLFNLKR